MIENDFVVLIEKFFSYVSKVLSMKVTFKLKLIWYQGTSYTKCWEQYTQNSPEVGKCSVCLRSRNKLGVTGGKWVRRDLRDDIGGIEHIT